MQAVKGVEEFFFSRFFAGDELNVIYQENINGTIFGPELFRGAIANGINDFVSELFRGDVEDRQAGLDALVSNSMQQVCFTEPHPTVQEEGIIRFARGLGNGKRGSVCQAIAIPYNKGVEGVARIETVMHQ